MSKQQYGLSEDQVIDLVLNSSQRLTNRSHKPSQAIEQPCCPLLLRPRPVVEGTRSKLAIAHRPQPTSGASFKSQCCGSAVVR